MILQRSFHIVLSFCILGVLAIGAGCEKDYSYEGGPVQVDSIIAPGTPGDSAMPFPSCAACNLNNTQSMTWSFKVGNSSLCGEVTNAVLSPDRDALTFFGPSFCSADSGLIITAYFDNQLLNADKHNIVASRAILQYYDNIGPSNVLVSKAPDVFNLTIERFTHQTGIATGSFGGFVRMENGAAVKVDTGKFNIQF